MASSGFSPADYEETVDVWPENWPACALFIDLSTQWRTGMAGATGLDYAVLFDLLDRRGYTGAAWEEMFADIRVLEEAALEERSKG